MINAKLHTTFTLSHYHTVQTNTGTFHVFCADRPTLRKLRAEDMFETWVSDDCLAAGDFNNSKFSFSIWLLTVNWLLYLSLFPQEDDIEGIHIVAFAEEEDPGKCMFMLYLTPLLLKWIKHVKYICFKHWGATPFVSAPLT